MDGRPDRRMLYAESPEARRFLRYFKNITTAQNLEAAGGKREVVERLSHTRKLGYGTHGGN